MKVAQKYHCPANDKRMWLFLLMDVSTEKVIGLDFLEALSLVLYKSLFLSINILQDKCTKTENINIDISIECTCSNIILQWLGIDCGAV